MILVNPRKTDPKAPDVTLCVLTLPLKKDGVTTFYSGDTPVIRQNADGTWDDLRGPPFHPYAVCPRCGAKNDRNHEPSKHVDPRLGVKV